MSCVYLSPLLTVLLYPPAVSQPRAGTRSCECAFLLSPYYAQVLPDRTHHSLALGRLSGVLYTRAGSHAARRPGPGRGRRG